MTAQLLSTEEQVKRSSKLLESFNGLYTGDVVTILATALQMAICYGARNKGDAMHMLECLMLDIEHDLPKQYDVVEAMIKDGKILVKRNGGDQ